MRAGYRALLERCLNAPMLFIGAVLAGCVVSAVLIPWVGRDFFPAVDAGQFKLHLRAKTGTRLEETARICDLVEAKIRSVIPAGRAGDHPRQHRPADQRHQPVLQQLRHRSARRTRTSSCR